MKEYKLHELKSSLMQYHKKDPKMGFMIIGITLVLLIGIIISAHFVKKTEVVKAVGVLSTTNKTYITSPTGGKIKTIDKHNGEHVEKGDLILELDTLQVDAQIIALDYKLMFLKDQVDDLDLFIESIKAYDYDNIENNQNPFEDGDFHIQYDSFLEAIANVEAKKTDVTGSLVDKTMSELREERIKIANQFLSQYYNQKKQYEYEYISVKGQKEANELTLNSYKIYAGNSGYINYSVLLSDGMVIGNDPIGTINEKLTKDNAIIEVYIDAKSRVYLEDNLTVDIVVSGLPQTEYGTLKGKISHISPDSIMSEGKVYYKLEIKPSEIKLSDINLVVGQTGEVRIKYEETTWLNWFLKKIGFN